MSLSNRFVSLLLTSLLVGPWLVPQVLPAQTKDVREAGDGYKQEIIHDSAGRVTEIRMINRAGVVESSETSTYGPHGETLARKTVVFSPDGHLVKKRTENTYDPGGNFLTEIVVVVDSTGRQTGGHSMFHDPNTGIYRCFDWSAAQQKLVAIECPAGEEDHGNLKVDRTIEPPVVLQQLTAAHINIKDAIATSGHTVPVAGSLHTARVGLVLPAVLSAGERVSGSVVASPGRFAGRSDLQVVTFDLPSESGEASVRLGDWSVDLAGAKGDADAPITFVVPVGPTIPVTLTRTSGAAASVSATIMLSGSHAKGPGRNQEFTSSALCFHGDICTVQGPFSGDAGKTFAAFDSAPARILAESTSSLYVEVPSYINLGQTVLAVEEGTQIAAMLTVVADASVSAAHEVVESGHELQTSLRVSGVAELSEKAWQYGIYPAANLEDARKLVPGFNPHKTAERLREADEKQQKKDGLHRKEEKWEESAGLVLVAVRNLTPETAVFRGLQGNQVVFTLIPDSFGRGDFVYDFVLDPSRSGDVNLQVVAIPFLAPVKAQMIPRP